MIGLAVLVVGLGVAAWFWIQRDTSRPVTLDEARDRRNETNGGLAPDPSGSDEPGSDGPVRPAAGVYEYEGTGTESLSLPPLSQSQGPTVPATVEHLATTAGASGSTTATTTGRSGTTAPSVPTWWRPAARAGSAG